MEFCESYFCDMKDLGRPQFLTSNNVKTKLGIPWTPKTKRMNATQFVLYLQKAMVDHLLFRFVLDDRCTRKAKARLIQTGCIYNLPVEEDVSKRELVKRICLQ